jgi:hypothetical protein
LTLIGDKVRTVFEPSDDETFAPFRFEWMAP